MLQQDFDIASWFAGYLAGNLTLEQQKALEEWCAASADHREGVAVHREKNK